ncbi:response regulator [Chloroflexota bacterium]
MEKLIRVLVVDDHAVVRAGLVTILGAESDISIVGEAEDGLEAINKALELKPDVIVMDIFMPQCSGLEAMVAMKESLPDARVLILTISDHEEDLFQAIKFGAQGYLLKSANITEVVQAVRMAAIGEATLSPHMATRLVAEFRQKGDEPQLSSREMQVLQLLADGLTNAEIGKRLFINESTVRTHLLHLLDKLHLRNRTEAAIYAHRHLI